MFRRRIMFALVVCLVATLVLSVAVAQDRTPRERGDRTAQAGGGQRGARPGAGEGRQFDPAQMRQMMEDRMREQLGATEAEWKTLGPRVMKVDQLNRQISGSGRGGMFLGSGRRGGPEGGQAAEMTAVEKATQQLRNVLRNESTSPEEIKKQLAALRTAREAAKKELAVAQQELRKSVDLRKEAQLVLMGLLD